MCRRNLPVFYWLAPDRSVAQVLRRGCRSGVDLGVVIERSVLLAPLARYPGGRWGLGKRGSKRKSGKPPGQRQRKEEKTVSGTSPGKHHPQGERVSVPDCRAGAPTIPRRRHGGMRLRSPTRRSDFFFWTVHGPFSFCQEQKENGGWNPAVITALPRARTGAFARLAT